MLSELPGGLFLLSAMLRDGEGTWFVRTEVDVFAFHRRRTGRMRIQENGSSVRLTELPSIIAVSLMPEIIPAYSVTTFSTNLGCTFPSERMTAASALRQLWKHRNFPRNRRTIWQFDLITKETRSVRSFRIRKLVTDNEFPPAGLGSESN